MTRKFLVEDARLPLSVTLTATDRSIVFTARDVVDYKARRLTRDIMMRVLLKAIDATHGKVWLASIMIELVPYERAWATECE